jgi:hypothetical protein
MKDDNQNTRWDYAKESTQEDFLFNLRCFEFPPIFSYVLFTFMCLSKRLIYVKELRNFKKFT